MDSKLDINQILQYWFAADFLDPTISTEQAVQSAKQQSKLWYRASAVVDQEIRDQFQPYLVASTQSRPQQTSWPATPFGQLAKVILLDQMSRHIYRGTAKAYAADELAQQCCLTAIENKQHEALPVIGQAFLFHPLKHAESRRLQDQSLALYQQLFDNAAKPWHNQLSSFLRYAKSHREIIIRFGRFPHRNAVLGRTNTLDESSYLKHNTNNYSQVAK